MPEPWGDITARGRHVRHLPETIYQEFVALRNCGLDLYMQGFSWSSVESFFVTGEEEHSEEEEEEDDDVDDADDADEDE